VKSLIDDRCVSKGEQSRNSGVVSSGEHCDRLEPVDPPQGTPDFLASHGPARAWIRPVANTTSTGSNQMKRHASNLLQHLRSRSESTDADRRNAAPRSITANIGLSAEDGYDWLRQLKPA
jgi:hypothetical protein